MIGEGIPAVRTRNLIKHEYGHAVDYHLNQQYYINRSEVMHEVMAIFVERALGVEKEYNLEGSPHKPAAQLLQGLKQTDFIAMNFLEQWAFLSPLIDHKEAPAYFQKHLRKKTFVDLLVAYGKKVKNNLR